MITEMCMISEEHFNNFDSRHTGENQRRFLFKGYIAVLRSWPIFRAVCRVAGYKTE